MSKSCLTCRYGYTRGTPKQSITQTVETTRRGREYIRYSCVTCGRTWSNRDHTLLWPLTFRLSRRWQFGLIQCSAGYKSNATQIQTVLRCGPLCLVFGRNRRMWALRREQSA